LQNGLKYGRALFDVGSQKDEESNHHQPPVAHQRSHHHEQERKDMADANGALRRVDHISTPPKQCAQNAAPIERVRRQQVQQSEVEVRPDDAPQERAEVKQWSGSQGKIRYCGEQDEGG
jgi:hypothetical protein